MPAVYPVEWLATSFQGKYPHLAKRDTPLWERFLTLWRDRFEAVAYDVALGGIIVTTDEISDAERKGWQYSTALRIDAAARLPAQIWIIEVRPEATVSALGAALCYTLVADRDAAFDRPLVPTIVCEAIQPDVSWACNRLGVQVFIMPAE